ncbi:MAG: hypothetical protein A2Y33_09515 [Spirochaetes bacterium GWF1_51_8]|nr:MAG: hypothetical protein A2Y33_09515 [Spirochaetes bacterium GWF1_51_8]
MKIRIQYKIFALFILIVAPLVGTLYLGINRLFVENFSEYLNSRVERSVETVESTLGNTLFMNMQFIKAFGTIAELNSALENNELLVFPYILEKYRSDYGFDSLQLYSTSGEIQAEAGRKFPVETTLFLKNYGGSGAFSGIVERGGNLYFTASSYSGNKKSVIVGKTLLDDRTALKISETIGANVIIYTEGKVTSSLLSGSSDGTNLMIWAERQSAEVMESTNRLIVHDEEFGLSIAKFPMKDFMGKPVGAIVIGMSSSWILESQKQQQELILRISIAGLLFAMIMAFIFARGITNPLRKLTFWAEKVSEGDLDYQVKIRAHDEVHDLSHAFSIMIGNLKKSFDEIHRQNIELKKLDQLKSDLISNVSHELRTPITTIFGSVEFLLSGEIDGDPDTVREFYGSIFNDIRVLKKIVNNFIMVSVIDKDEFFEKDIELKGFLTEFSGQEIDTDLRPLASEKNIAIEVPGLKHAGKKKIVMRSDETYLRHVLFELVHNAVIYNREGGKVKLGVETGADGLSFRVEDNGIGISESEAGKIFDRFYRVVSERTYEVSGIGLGLSVVRQICERLGLKIVVESETGKGTAIIITGISYTQE